MEPKKVTIREVGKLDNILSFENDLTPEEIAAVAAHARSVCPTEDELRELLRQRENGLLVSSEELQKWIHEATATHKEPA